MLVDNEIKTAVQNGAIAITPYNEANVGTNSYDVTLGDTLHVIEPKSRVWRFINRVCPFVTFIFRNAAYSPHDCKEKHPYQTREITIPASGYVLRPFVAYLGVTKERTNTPNHVPIIYGKSSLGRLFMLIHFTAGFGDVGFNNHWTLELMTLFPTRVYAGQKIGQIVFFRCNQPDVKYNKKPNAKYNYNGTAKPGDAIGEL